MKPEIKPRKTPLYDKHVKWGAKIVDFHGWLMPIQYKGIVSEHIAVRNRAGIFDVSHMGEVQIMGKDAYRFVQNLITNNLDKIGPGRALYSPMCNEAGGIIDDLIVYMFSREHFFVVVNAACVDKDFGWMLSHKGSYSVVIENISDSIALISLQGPSAAVIMEKTLGQPVDLLKRFHFSEFTLEGNKIMIARTGYTGEDGFELFVDAGLGGWLWDKLMAWGPEPAGLGARDTLRLEKKYILYGDDATDETTPMEASLQWTVDMGKDNFIGKDALLKKKARKRLVGIEMNDAGIPRRGCPILCRDIKIGTITSGSYSPQLRRGVALGYVERDCPEINIEIRGRLYKAKIVSGKK